MALVTPLTCWYTPCTPQKQPPASTIVAEVAWPGGRSTAGSGSTCAASAATGLLLNASAASARNANTNSVTGAIEESRFIVGLTSFLVPHRGFYAFRRFRTSPWFGRETC